MSLIIRSVSIGSLALWCLAVAASQVARAEGPQILADELREFEISVQDKAVGTNQIRITETDDGATAVAVEVSVKCDFFVYVYRYELHGKETWQGDQLVAVDNRAVDNGTRLVVRAKASPAGSLIDTGGKAPVKGPALEMTTNFWRRPTAKAGQLAFVDVDKGTIIMATLEHVGAEPLTVGTEKIQCNHDRLRGDVNADLWFDSRGRLVRQRTIEMGLPTELRLVRLTAKGGAIARR